MLFGTIFIKAKAENTIGIIVLKVFIIYDLRESERVSTFSLQIREFRYISGGH